MMFAKILHSIEAETHLVKRLHLGAPDRGGPPRAGVRTQRLSLPVLQLPRRPLWADERAALHATWVIHCLRFPLHGLSSWRCTYVIKAYLSTTSLLFFSFGLKLWLGRITTGQIQHSWALCGGCSYKKLKSLRVRPVLTRHWHGAGPPGPVDPRGEDESPCRKVPNLVLDDPSAAELSAAPSF